MCKPNNRDPRSFRLKLFAESALFRNYFLSCPLKGSICKKSSSETARLDR